jgi:hypothetical protein
MANAIMHISSVVSESHDHLERCQSIDNNNYQKIQFYKEAVLDTLHADGEFQLVRHHSGGKIHIHTRTVGIVRIKNCGFSYHFGPLENMNFFVVFLMRAIPESAST